MTVSVILLLLIPALQTFQDLEYIQTSFFLPKELGGYHCVPASKFFTDKKPVFTLGLHFLFFIILTHVISLFLEGNTVKNTPNKIRGKIMSSQFIISLLIIIVLLKM